MGEYERAPAAERIKQGRLRTGVLTSELAAALQISPAAYDDLEAFDDEAFTSISLFQVGTLADRLGVGPHELVAPPGARVVIRMAMESLIEAVRTDIARKPETAEALSERVGWDISRALDEPQSAWREWNLDCLQDVCRSVGLSWLNVLAAWPGRRAV